jgi:hypothetical protein
VTAKLANSWKTITSRQPNDSRCATDFLARLLVEAGRLIDALPLLQELFNSQTPNFDVGLLLNCAGRLKQDQIVLDTCQALYERGVRSWQVLDFESRYLEQYNFPKAISRLQGIYCCEPRGALGEASACDNPNEIRPQGPH